MTPRFALFTTEAATRASLPSWGSCRSAPRVSYAAPPMGSRSRNPQLDAPGCIPILFCVPHHLPSTLSPLPPPRPYTVLHSHHTNLPPSNNFYNTLTPVPQAFELGKWLRERYCKQLGFLPDKYEVGMHAALLRKAALGLKPFFL